MNQDQAIILVVLALTVAMFAWGRWRHDMVAVGALLACVAFGLVPPNGAFTGFGHPAVITVACVLILSRGLLATGAIDAVAQRILPMRSGPLAGISALVGVGALLSAFMNNVGAIALLMPLGMQLARRQNLPPGRVLMPLSFGTILGGMTTLIGTPPNLIVSAFRNSTHDTSFGMFDYAPVGTAVAVCGIAFIVLLGWRLVPARTPEEAERFDTGAYLTEVRVGDASKASGMRLADIEQELETAEAQVVGMVRNEFRISAPNPQHPVHSGDILVIQADPESLSQALFRLGLELEEKEDSDNDEGDAEDAKVRWSRDTELRELVVMPASNLINRSARDIRLRTRFGINLLAISHRGRRSIKRLQTTDIRAGDVLLLQGPPEALTGFASIMRCVPLAARSLDLPDVRQAWSAIIILALAVAGSAFGLLPAAIAFAGGVLAYMALKVLPLRSIYESVDWPVIVLLGALIPVAGAMASTGTADLIAVSLHQALGENRPVVTLALVLILSMTLSDFMNNAATAAVMCPIAISTAAELGVNSDAFLMAVAVGASCAFLTPIGHQNNTLILGPGGFRFGDYWRLGLPLEIIVVAVGIPMLLWIWPL